MNQEFIERYAKLGAAQRRTEEIYICLRDRICLLHYPPGTKLSESKLASEFGVSRSPIRRALHRLELEHLAERRQGSQTVVTSFDFESVRDVYVIRILLEANLSSLSPSKNWWECEDAFLEIHEECLYLAKNVDLDELGKLHLKLQQTHASIIENHRAREILMQLYFQISRIWLSMVPKMNWEEEISALSQEIEESISAIKERDLYKFGIVRKKSIEENIKRIELLMKA